MSNTLFWITVILLIVVLALIVWLLFTGKSTEIIKQKLNQPCKQTSDCNTGLVCDVNQNGSGVCKVASGGVCSVDTECAEGLECNNGICMAKGGDLNEPCPCNKGFTCINKVCKAVNGEPCRQDSDCADGRCCGGVCLAYDHPSCGSSDCSGYSDSKYDSDCTSFTDSKYSKSHHNKHNKHKHRKHSYDDISFSDDDSHYSYCRSVSSGKESDCNCSSRNKSNNNKSSSSLRYSTYTVSNSLY